MSDVITELLIVSLTPQNLERGVLWFEENFSAIKKTRFMNPWWRDNAIILEKDAVIKPSDLSRKLLDFGYDRSASVPGKGVFALRGGVIEVWPINTDQPYSIEFFGNVVAHIYQKERAEEKIKIKRSGVASIDFLSLGTFLVHEDHGIGIFRGLTEDKHFFTIEYAPARSGGESDKLYVPLESKDRLTPYIGFETPKIHRLGGAAWQTTKRKVKEDTEKLARQLLELYAKRHRACRPAYQGDKNMEEEVRIGFIHQETPDQIKAEHDTLHDLEKNVPMDRVLCGDVGFGKTEIAIRAAMRVIASGYQVVVLAPTTILAAQHEKTFQERLQNFPVTVRMLSRLSNPQSEKEILEALQSGRIDCLIGTHRILSEDIVFKNLGLLIVDEEQRFGVKQKEKMKEMRTALDILSLSATPIPRTLQLALSGIRDLSMLMTPPPERKPIMTAVLPYSKKTIRESIDFELDRGGQIYFLHNRIETIGHVKKMLASLKTKHKPTIEIMHGRMSEKDILKAMRAFRNKECNILLATTIIENGLDISSANTIIVDDATRLGLAETHQLRGRIGRGSEQAFAYFLYKPKYLSDRAGERLEALKEYSELGSGYDIALRDFEIRGAGNILGREQSGAINKVGINLYYHMLQQAVEEMK